MRVKQFLRYTANGMNTVLNILGISGNSNEPDPETGLTRKEKHLVEKSWSLVKTDIKGNGIDLFLLLFKECPELKSYFPFRDVTYEELHKNGKFKAHAITVMYAIGAMIDHLNENEILLGLLQKTGASHGKKGIPESAYWELKRCILLLLKTKLKAEFTKEVESAWDKTLIVVMSVVIKNL